MAGGKEKIAKILSRLSSKEAQKILEYIKNKNIKLADDIEKMMFTFDDIIQLTEKDMRLLHGRIDISDVALVLKSVPEDIETKLLSGISENKKKTILQERSFLGKVKVKDIDSAKNRIAETIRSMIENGEITLSEEWIE